MMMHPAWVNIAAFESTTQMVLHGCMHMPQVLHALKLGSCCLQVHLDFIILPAWLYLTRQVLQKQMVAEAVMLAIDMIVLALLAGTIYQADQAEKLAKRQGRLTPQQAAMLAPAAPLVAKGWYLRLMSTCRSCIATSSALAARCSLMMVIRTNMCTRE